MSRFLHIWKKQSFRPPSATESLSLAGPRESNQREWPEDPTLPRVVTRDEIFRQDIRVLSKNGGRPDRRPPGLRFVRLLERFERALNAQGSQKRGQVHLVKAGMSRLSFVWKEQGLRSHSAIGSFTRQFFCANLLSHGKRTGVRVDFS